jgi:hypothetical protein
VGLGLCLIAGVAVAGEYRSLDAVRQQLERWAGEHGARMKLEEIGRSTAGAPLLVARVAADGDVDPDRRPAVFVGANIAGYHNAGTEAALHLLETLLTSTDEGVAKLLAAHTFYVAPALNPDAHDGMFASPRRRLAGRPGTGGAAEVAWPSLGPLDRDLDGLAGEDPPDDLDGDGRITTMRIADSAGGMLPDPDDPRVMVKADPLEGQSGAYRVVTEGSDDDGDGKFNEDPGGGVEPSRNFAHAYEADRPEAGPWPSYASETRAVMDFLLARRNVALAVVYGPANNLLSTPRSLGGGGGDPGTLKFKVPTSIAEFVGLDPEKEYTIDEVWEVVKDLSFVRQNNITKEQVLQFLGAGPAVKLEDADVKYFEKLAGSYKERLEQAGLDNKREGKQYRAGGFTPWLYYQYGAMAIELDVWGVPKAERKDDGEDDALTLDRLEEMSNEEFLALGEDKIGQFLKDIGAPPQFTAAAVIQRVESGGVTPKQMAQMARRMGGGGGAAAKKGGGPGDLMTFVDAHAPEAFVPWTEVTLADGTKAEVGGVDPFVEIAPPYALLEPALAVHTATVLDLAGKLARVEILELESEDLGGGVFRVEATAGNRGFLPTHTRLAQRAQSHLPVRLEIVLGEGAELVTGPRWTTGERLDGENGTLKAQWLVRVAGRSARVDVDVVSDQAGTDRRSLELGEEGR